MRMNPATGQLEEAAFPDFRWVAPDTLQLYVNDQLAQQWTVAAVTTSTLTGQPYGLLLALTQP